METTQTDIPVQETSRPAWLDEASARRGGGGSTVLLRRVGVIGLVVAAIVVAVTLGPSWFSGTGNLPDIKLFEVSKRSFVVPLREQGELKSANVIDIRSELEGRATIIFLVAEGTRVSKGDLLVELASDQIDESIRDAEIKVAAAEAAHEAAVKELEILRDENASKVRKAQLALEMAKLALERYEAGEKIELEQDAKLALEKAKSVLQRDKDYLTDSEELYKQGYITKIELENDRFKAYEAEIELKKAELGLEVLETYTFPMDLREKQSDVQEAEKELDREWKSASASEAKAAADVAAKQSELQLVREKLVKLNDQKTKSKIFAPADGLVVYARSSRYYRSSEDEVKVGSQVHERQSLIELPDTSSMKVVIRVHEAQVEHLKEGLPATVQIEGVTGKTYTGKVAKIAVQPDSESRWLNPNLKQYETEVLLDGSFTELKPGTTAHVEVKLAELRDVLAVPVQSVFAKGGKYFVFADTSGGGEPKGAVMGLANNEFAEIKSGLAVGDQVYLALTDEMKLLLPDADDDEPDARPDVRVEP